jgi:SsrA-binding protein
MHIGKYKDCGYSGNGYDEKKDRKLLLKKTEILELDGQVKKKGYTIVPVELFENSKGLMKLKICLARGKKDFDKREDIKARDIERELRKGF